MLIEIGKAFACLLVVAAAALLIWDGGSGYADLGKRNGGWAALSKLLGASFVIWMLWTSAAPAAVVMLGYDHGFGGSTDPTFPKPIDHSTALFDFTEAVGRAQLGVTVEAFQNGRAGLASDHVGGHLGAPVRIGVVTFTPGLQVGYARAPNYDYGYWGAEGRAAVQMPGWPTLSTELGLRRRQSFLENYFPNLKGSDLPTTKWHETRFELVEVLALSHGLAVGLRGAIDAGTNPDQVLGVLLRRSF